MSFKTHNYIQQWNQDISQNIMVGILMGLALLPTTIAFSFIVHVSPTIGIMSCGLMLFFISFLGVRLSMVSGPSSGISIVGAPLVEHYNVHYLIAATIVMGLILFIFGLCHIDKVLKLIPDTVVMGFMNALGILLLTTQIKYIFGISVATYIVAIATFAIIFLSSKLIRGIPAPLIAIILVSVGSYIIKPHVQLVHDLADIHIAIPKFAVPTELFHFHALSVIILYALTMAIISVVQTNLTNEMMNVITQSPTDKDKEVVAQGIANVLVGLFGGYGGSALVGQSKFNHRMGATTRLATLITGLLLLSCIFILAPIVGLIPMAVLASVLITISLNTFDRRTFKHLREAPITRTFVMLFTIILILSTHNLAIGVVAGTIVYYIVQFILRKGGRSTI
ncbi:sulfate permease [Staphylococcus petrasii]|uniref:SulP family inorganic anion transporter n=2 Tax=Staphylococcus petrasii TaxID=1276936 RepID=A0A380FYU5_9STAP|nr:SulP family inorganic anion transporter [Staphylococcus petrasii]PNZ26808.1 SulP family inorganic anion transporter [Staphylococcus petrasii]TGE12055.1 SulP family inorganic anion transporter [Staphylococcus petrasii]TGE19145.1 SulP family inorganic anion transporter [Staphylococcus petrasii]SUM43168.1 sulfate permease [Staphylococcus petrasii]